MVRQISLLRQERCNRHHRTEKSAQENGHRHDTGAARGRINLNKKGGRGEERGGEEQRNAAGETALGFRLSL